MANLELIKSLNKHYSKDSSIKSQVKLFSLNEALDPENIQKAIEDSLASMGPEFTMYFDLGLSAEVALLFIDVCHFSTRYSHLLGEEIGEYFDQYYDIVIPMIYKYGGEIDKIMGDGIICIFGPPFTGQYLTDNISNADKCAKEIIKKTRGTEYTSKVAFHCGSINYFKNKTGLYKEFTMIGKPLTELFRLESVSIDETINYYDGSDIRNFYCVKIDQSSIRNPFSKSEWLHSSHNIELVGVSFDKYYTIKFNE